MTDHFQNTISTYLSRFPQFLYPTKGNSCGKFQVVIPVYNEPDLEKILESLLLALTGVVDVSVTFVVNHSELAIEEVKQQSEISLILLDHYSHFLPINFIDARNLPHKFAGVGLARKIGMDWVVRNCEKSKVDSWVICLDADCEINQEFFLNLHSGISERPDAGIVLLNPIHRYWDEPDLKLKEGILHYEVFLFYYALALQWAGFPYWYLTIGSSMGCKASVYAFHGGMNKRKAGEDFYFLHKLFPHHGIAYLDGAVVFPSCRISDRVPFGTGRAQQKYLELDGQAYLTYSFQSFIDLQVFLSQLKNILFANGILKVSDAFGEFLKSIDAEHHFMLIRESAQSEKARLKRFYEWFDGFMVLKWLHWSRDFAYDNQPLISVVSAFFEKIKPHYLEEGLVLENYLTTLRELYSAKAKES